MKFNYLMFNNSMALVYSSGIPIIKQGAVSVGRFSLLSSSRTEIKGIIVLKQIEYIVSASLSC